MFILEFWKVIYFIKNFLSFPPITDKVFPLLSIFSYGLTIIPLDKR